MTGKAKVMRKQKQITQDSSSDSNTDEDLELGLNDSEDLELTDDEEPSLRPTHRPKAKPATATAKCSTAVVRSNLKTGQFVSAIYQGDWYIAQVIAVTSDAEIASLHPYSLSYMTRKGPNMFVWPDRRDELLTFHEDILTRVGAPIPLTSRGFLGLNKEDLALTLDAYRHRK